MPRGFIKFLVPGHHGRSLYPEYFIFLVALLLWFIAKEIFDSATINTTNGKALLVSSYVIQTTLIVDGIFIVLAILQPTFSGLV